MIGGQAGGGASCLSKASVANAGGADSKIRSWRGGWRSTGVVIFIMDPHLHLVCDSLMAAYI